MKKIISLTMAILICCSFCAVASAEAINEGRLLTENGEMAGGSIDDIKSLISERNEAVLAGNAEEADSLLDEIYALGAWPSTDEELASLSPTGAMNINRAKDFDSITSEYYSYVNGTPYKIKEVNIVVGTNCNLYHAYDVSVKTSQGRVEAGIASIFEACGSTALGYAESKLKEYLSIFDVLKNVIGPITKTTVVDNVKASYAVTLIEQCTFYSYLNNNRWVNYSATQYVEYEVTSTIRGIDYTGTGITTIDNTVVTYGDKIYAGSEYDYTGQKQLSEYFKTYLAYYKNSVTSFMLIDSAGDVINSRGLTCPHNISYIY